MQSITKEHWIKRFKDVLRKWVEIGLKVGWKIEAQPSFFFNDVEVFRYLIKHLVTIRVFDIFNNFSKWSLNAKKTKQKNKIAKINAY